MTHPSESKLPTASLSLRLFGACDVRREGGPLLRTRSRKELWLLALLALRPHRALDREWLAGTLWPEARQEAALANLRRSLADLRRVLGSDASRLTCPTPRTLSLDLDGVTVDVLEFDAAIEAGDATSLERAIALYRGPLLEGCLEEWVFPERREREAAWLNALESLASSRGEHSEAARLLHRAVSTDPLRESAQRALMEVLAASGDYAALDRHYRDLRLALRREVNAEPAEETTSLYRLLRARGRAASPSPPRSDAAPLRRLPCPLTRLVGRNGERKDVVVFLKLERLVTLTGSGGVGKTRLAIAVAEHIADGYPDGVWFVDLAPLTDSGLVAQAVASALGVREEPGRTLTQTLTDHLRSKTLLLLLDNCEHLLGACSRLAEDLLATCSGLRILATSRERLNIAGELIYRVPSLSLPDLASLPSVESLTQYEAVHLFIERALSVQPQFIVTNQNAPALAQVCVRLDGIPLALELAAARVRSLSVEEINAKLDERFRLLTGGSRTALPRQQTLRALIDWSYDLLTDQEKALLCRLSVFAGGWTLEAAEQVCAGYPLAGGGIEEWEMLDLLTALVDKSLVVYEEPIGETRYRLLETVRQYSRDRLMESGESDTYRRRHRDYFLALAEDAKERLKGPEQGRWLSRLEMEHDNLRQAVAFCLDEAEGGDPGLRLGAALQRFWWTRGHLSEGRERLTALLARPEAKGHTKARANALNGVATLSMVQGDYASALSRFQESLAIRRELEDTPGIADSLNNLGAVAHIQGDYTFARSLYEECLETGRILGDRNRVAVSLNNLGEVARFLGDYASARSLHQESLEIYREFGDRHGIASSLGNLGVVAYSQSDYTSSRTLHEESLAIWRELEGRQGIAITLNNLGLVACSQRDFTSARSVHKESLNISRELGDIRGIVCSLESFASLNATEDEQVRVARLWGAAERLREEIGSPLSPNDLREYDRDVVAARQTMSEEAFAAAWAEGRAMSMEEAIEYALEDSEE